MRPVGQAQNRTVVLFLHKMPSPPPDSASQKAVTEPPDSADSRVVGVLDSGAGGLSVLPALRAAMPGTRFIYVADSGYAPYGERSDDWLQTRCAALAAFLRSRGAAMLVLACNSATAAAAAALRARYPQWPIVGIEPGVKPAVLQSPTGRIGVMATTATLRSPRYARLLTEHGLGAQVLAQACTGLAMAIERGAADEIARLVALHTAPLKRAQVDTVVLGCTHYPFARPWIEAAMGPGVRIVDTAEAVARHTAQLMKSQAPGLSTPMADTPRGDEFWTSGPPEGLASFAEHWLGWRIRVSKLDVLAPATAPDAAAQDR